MRSMRVRIKKLSGAGHDETELDAIQEDFDKLVKSGYALFVKEVQVRTLAEAEEAWGELEGTVELVAVPALRGGSIDVAESLPPSFHIDPVCGVDILLTDTQFTSTQFTSTHENIRYYFCSDDCLQKFLDEPRDFVEVSEEDREPEDA